MASLVGGMTTEAATACSTRPSSPSSVAPDRGVKRARTSSTSDGALHVIVPLVAGFLRQGEARGRLAPVSKSMRTAASRAPVVTIDTNDPCVVAQMFALHGVDRNTRLAKDAEWSRIFRPALYGLPDCLRWKPFANAGHVLALSVLPKGAVAALVPLSAAQCAAAGLNLADLRVGDALALPHLEPQASDGVEKFDWGLKYVRVIAKPRQDKGQDLKTDVKKELEQKETKNDLQHDTKLVIMVPTMADLATVGSWHFRARGGWALGNLWARLSRKPVSDGVTWGDDIVPKDLLAACTAHIDALAQDRTPDYRPGTDKVVRNHVDPMLYGFEVGVSKFEPSKDLPKMPSFGAGLARKDHWGRLWRDARYTAIASYFDLDSDKRVTIRNDINGLRPADKYTDLYKTIARTFQTVVPRVEAVLSYVRWFKINEDCSSCSAPPSCPKPSPKCATIPSRCVECIDEAVPLERVNLANSALQVVTKIMDYELEPGQEYTHKPYKYLWQVAGMAHEHIVATCITVLEQDPAIKGGELVFQRAFTAAERKLFTKLHEDKCSPAFKTLMEFAHQPLGRVATQEGRTIVFPNSHEYRLTKMTNTSNQPARRRVLVFFIVDPNYRVVSTQEVPDQSKVLTPEEARKRRIDHFEERNVNCFLRNPIRLRTSHIHHSTEPVHVYETAYDERRRPSVSEPPRFSDLLFSGHHCPICDCN